MKRFDRMESGYLEDNSNLDQNIQINFRNPLKEKLNLGSKSSLYYLEPRMSSINIDQIKDDISKLSNDGKYYSLFKYILNLKKIVGYDRIESIKAMTILQLENMAFRRFSECQNGQIHPKFKVRLNDIYKDDEFEKIVDQEDWFFFKELLEVDVSDTYIEFYIINFYINQIQNYSFENFNEILKLYNRIKNKNNPTLVQLIRKYTTQYFINELEPNLIKSEMDAKEITDVDIDITINMIEILKSTNNENEFRGINTSLINHLSFINNIVIGYIQQDAINADKLNQYEIALLKIIKVVQYYEAISSIGNFEAQLKYFKTAFNDLTISKSIDLTNNKKFGDSNINLRLIHSSILQDRQIEIIKKLENINNLSIENEIEKKNLTSKAKNYSSVNLPKNINPNKTSNLSFTKIIMIIILFVIAVISFSYISNMSQDVNKKEEVADRELPLPKNGEIFRKTYFTSNEDNNSQFTIKASPSYSHVIKIYEESSDKLFIMFFVRAGDEVEIIIPSGSYEIRVASGEKWYGISKFFGKDTSVAVLDKIFRVTEGGGFEITLQSVNNGNLDQNYIDIEDF